MTQALFFALTGAALVGIGVYGLLQNQHPLRQLLALNVVGASIFLILVAFAKGGEGPPDPVPHAMVLTGIVIAISATAYGLALIRRLHGVEAKTDSSGDT